MLAHSLLYRAVGPHAVPRPRIPFKYHPKLALSGVFGGVLGDKENAGSEARAAAVAAAQGKLAQEVAHHLKGAAPSPSACCKQQQQQQQQQQHGLSKTSGLTPTMRSVFFAATAAAAPAADAVNSPKAVVGAAGLVLPLSPSSNTNFDRYGGGGREGMSPYSRTVGGTGFALAHAGAAVLRGPATRTKKPVASKREAQERRGCGVDGDEVRFCSFGCTWDSSAAFFLVVVRLSVVTDAKKRSIFKCALGLLSAHERFSRELFSKHTHNSKHQSCRSRFGMQCGPEEQMLKVGAFHLCLCQQPAFTLLHHHDIFQSRRNLFGGFRCRDACLPYLEYTPFRPLLLLEGPAWPNGNSS